MNFFSFTICKKVGFFLNSFKRGDTFDQLKSKLKQIDPFYLRVFIICFLLTNLVFLIYTTSYLFGNHDFAGVKYGVEIQLWNGRYANALPLKLIGGNISPVLNSLLSIFAMTISAMALCAYFDLPKRLRYWLPTCLLPMLLPHVTTWFYYAYETFSHTLLPGAAVAALWLVRDRISLERMMLSIGLIWFVLGVYPSILVVFISCIGGQFILDILNGCPWKQIFLRWSRFIATLLPGTIAFSATLFILRSTGKMSPSLDNLSMPSYAELIHKLWPEFVLSLRQFFHPTPYIPVFLKIILLAILVIAISISAICATSPKVAHSVPKFFLPRMKNGLLLLLAWGCMFWGTMLPDFLSNGNYSFVIRTGYFGVPFLVVIGLTLIFRFGKKVVRNAVLFGVLFVLWYSMISDFEIQKNWKIGFQNEMLAYSRVLAMIEQNKEVQKLTMPINYLQVGSLPSGRKPFCRPTINDDYASLEMHSFQFNPDWSPRAGSVLGYLGTHLRWKYSGSFRVDTPTIATFFDLTSPQWLDFLRKARPYPASPENCLYVDRNSNSLVIVLDGNVLQKLQQDCGVAN